MRAVPHVPNCISPVPGFNIGVQHGLGQNPSQTKTATKKNVVSSPGEGLGCQESYKDFRNLAYMRNLLGEGPS